MAQSWPRLSWPGSPQSQRLWRPCRGMSEFHSISDSESYYIPHKNKECLYNPLPHVSHFSFNRECFPAVVQTTVRGNAVPEPSDLTCISISYQFKCQKHMFPLCLPSDSQTYILLWFPQRRKRLNVLGGPVPKQHARSQGSKHSVGPVRAADRRVGTDRISWKGPKGETIQLTSAQSK